MATVGALLLGGGSQIGFRRGAKGPLQTGSKAMAASSSRWRPAPRSAVLSAAAPGGGREVKGKPAMPKGLKPPVRRAANPEDPDAVCFPATVDLDNASDPDHTIIVLEVADYPGLLRSVSWLLNGLDMVVEEAHITTPDDGVVKDTFWLTTRQGSKLDDVEAAYLAERVQDFVQFCQPDESVKEADVFSSDEVMVNNYLDDKYSVVSVRCETCDKPGFMLELVTAMTALGLHIREGFVKRNTCGDEDEAEDCQELRKFEFLVTDHQGAKLDYVLASGLIFTLSLMMGEGCRLRAPAT